MLPKATSGFLLCLLFLAISANGQNTQQALMRLLDSVNAPQNGPVRSSRTAAPFIQSGVNNRQASFQSAVASGAISMRQNTICRDTSERFFLATDTLVYYTNDPYQTADGNYLLSGQCQRNYSPYKNVGGYLMKFNRNGNIIWNKNYDSVNSVESHWINYTKILELQDGSILLAGYTDNRITKNYDIVFTKTTSTGNLVWTKVFNSRLWPQGYGTGSFSNIQQLKQDPASGDVYVAWSFAFGASMFRLNINTGIIAWSKTYRTSADYNIPFGLDIKPNEIKLITRYLYASITSLCLYRINKTNGDTISTKVVSAVDTTGYQQQIITPNLLTVQNNGNYFLSGRCYGYFRFPGSGLTPLYHASVIEMDSNFNFTKAHVFRNTIESNSYNTRISMNPDGTGYFTMLHYISGYSGDVYSIQFKNGQILKQRKKVHNGEGYPYEPQALQLSNGGNLIVRTMGDSASNLTKIEFLKLHPTDTSSYCLGFDDEATSMVTLNYVPDEYRRTYDSNRSNVLSESQTKTLVEKNLMAVKQPGCFQVSTCDSLQLITAQPTICQSQTLQIIARKNRGCGSSVLWNYNIAVVSSAVRVNDSTIAFRFNAPWSGYIYGSIQGCTTIIDSVYISVVQSPASLHLGPDTVICPGNTIVLNAHAGYTAYQWQNGSTDSVFTVTGPGTYHVSVTDACSGAIYKDTVVVSLRPQAPISAGPDRTKCNNDTLRLNAPAGFINYAWLPAYNINALSGASVIVNPAVDTAYVLKAEKTPGCFAMDTVRITVFHSPAIQLGPDTSLCAGQAITVSAGTGFTAYQWNNGSTNRQNTFNATGTYTVMGTTAQGCTSYDTFRISNIYPLPNVGLNHNSELCTGTSRTLDAGAFATYRWQDGSAGSTFTAQGTGTYYVQVTDSHGCTGTDTTTITTLLPLPGHFLPADTAICQYETLTLQPLQTFTSYLWSTNSRLPTAMASTAGTYWLQVRDNKGCAGADSITLRAKECLKGLFVPSAFTPNNDGKNDRLKALLFGQVKRYDFKIYNRFGQPVFSTKDAAAAWDGMIHGEPQTAGVYVWICTYQLSGEQSKTERGTVVLIR